MTYPIGRSQIRLRSSAECPVRCPRASCSAPCSYRVALPSVRLAAFSQPPTIPRCSKLGSSARERRLSYEAMAAGVGLELFHAGEEQIPGMVRRLLGLLRFLQEHGHGRRQPLLEA